VAAGDRDDPAVVHVLDRDQLLRHHLGRGRQLREHLLLDAGLLRRAAQQRDLARWFFLIATPLGVLLAYQIDREIRGHRFYQSAYYIPVVLSLAVTGIIWNFMLRPDGFVNGLLGRDIDNAVSFFGNYDINIYVIMVMASWRHIGYIMLLYLAGLKAVDPALREAAAIDGATEWETFRKVVLPTMRPVNIIIVVITMIESLRAFDMVYVIYGTSAGLPILGILVFQNIAGEGASMKGAAYAVILFVLSIGPIIAYLRQQFRQDVS
jgi:multiple sugar transport system permease protein